MGVLIPIRHTIHHATHQTTKYVMPWRKGYWLMRRTSLNLRTRYTDKYVARGQLIHAKSLRTRYSWQNTSRVDKREIGIRNTTDINCNAIQQTRNRHAPKTAILHKRYSWQIRHTLTKGKWDDKRNKQTPPLLTTKENPKCGTKEPPAVPRTDKAAPKQKHGIRTYAIAEITILPTAEISEAKCAIFTHNGKRESANVARVTILPRGICQQ